MRRKGKIIIAINLILIFMLTIMLQSVHAETTTGTIDSGKVTWSFDSGTGTLTFSGSGVITGDWKDHIEKSSVLKVKINEGITSIGYDMFNDCYRLTSIEIPNSVTNLVAAGLEWCRGLTSINVKEQNKNYSSENGVLFNKDKTKILQYPRGKKESSYIVPESVTTIRSNAFFTCTSLTNIEIPDSVTSIGYNAFCQCTRLTSIEIPNSVTSIGWDAFGWCSRLTSINVGEQNKNYSSENGILFNKDKTCIIKYPEEKEGSSYTIPYGVTRIESSAFCGCSRLTSVEIPYGVTSIGHSAFNGCYNLTSVKIPNGVTSIGYGALNRLKKIGIPDSVVSIGESVVNSGATIYYKSNNIVKSYADANNIACEIDVDGPIVTLSQEGSYINIEAIDSGVGLQMLPYSIDGINWTSDNKILINQTGEYTIYARDLLDNVSETKIFMDFDKPEITGVSASNYKIAITATDNMGLAEEAYSIDGVNYQKSNILSVNQDGMYTIYVKDFKGNVASKEIYIRDGNTIEIGNVVVYDSVLAKRLQQTLGNNVVSVEEKSGKYEISIASNYIYSIDLSAKRDENGNIEKIKDIRGLEGFKNLTSLYLNNNEVQNLSELKNNKKLRTLSIRYNNLKDLECVKDINSLVQLDASRNEIEDISGLANLTKLETLILNNNTIEDKLSPLNELQNLQILNISDNLITDLSGLNKLKLKEFYCSHNQVKDISPINKANLKKFEMKHNCVYIYFNDTDSGIEIPSLLQYEIEKSGGTDNLRMEVATIENNKIVIPRNGSEVKPEVDIRVKSGDFEGSGFLLRNNKFYVPGEVTIHKFKVDDGSINAELWSTDARFGINKNSSDNDDWQAVNDKSTGYRKNYTYNVENERVNAYNIYKDSQGYNMLGEDIEDLVINIDDVVNKNIPDLKLSYSTAEYTNKDVVVTISSSENLCIDPNNNERNWKLSEDKKSMTCTLSENAKFDVDVMLEKDYQSVGNYNDIHKEKVVVNVMNIDKEVGTTFHNGITYFFDYKDIHENSAYITLEADEPIEVVKTSGKVVEGGRRHVLSRPLYHVKIYYKHDVNEIVEVKDRCSNIRKYEVNIKGVDGEVDGLNVSNKTNVATKPNIKINVYANEPIKIEKNTPLRMPKVKIASRAVDTEESITNADDGISTLADEGIQDEEYKDQHEVTVEENSYGVVKVRDVVGNTDLTVYDVSNIDSAKPIVVEQKEEVLEDGSKRVTLILNEEIKQTDRLNGWVISADGMQISKVFKESTTEKIVIEDLAGNEAEIEVVVDVTKKEPSNEGEQGPKQDNEQDQNQKNEDKKNEQEEKQKFPSRIPQAGKNAIIVGVTFIALVAMSVVLYKKSNKFNI